MLSRRERRERGRSGVVIESFVPFLRQIGVDDARADIKLKKFDIDFYVKPKFLMSPS